MLPADTIASLAAGPLWSALNECNFEEQYNASWLAILALFRFIWGWDCERDGVKAVAELISHHLSDLEAKDDISGFLSCHGILITSLSHK